MTLGEKIQNLRKEREMTQTEFAERFGVSRQAVSKWELDQMMPELPKLIEIADDFDVSLDELVRDKEKTESGGGQQTDGHFKKSSRQTVFKVLLIIIMEIWFLYGSAPDNRWRASNLIDINFLLLIMAAAAVTAVLKLIFYQKYEFMDLFRYVVIFTGGFFSAIMLMTHMKYGLAGFQVSILPFFYSLVLELAAAVLSSLIKTEMQEPVKQKRKQML